jgi:hypothetical protein
MSGWVTRRDIEDIRSFGVTVIEQPGWENKSDMMLSIAGLMLHHDALALGLNDNPNDDFNVPNHMGTPGVLGSQFWASTRGEVVIMAAGGKGHAGLGQWGAIPRDRGNNYCAAIETDHTIGTGWSDRLRRGIDVVSFVVVRNHGVDVSSWACGHREYAPTRKSDPDAFDLNDWRRRISTGQIYGGSGQGNCFGWSGNW